MFPKQYNLKSILIWTKCTRKAFERWFSQKKKNLWFFSDILLENIKKKKRFALSRSIALHYTSADNMLSTNVVDVSVKHVLHISCFYIPLNRKQLPAEFISEKNKLQNCIFVNHLRIEIETPTDSSQLW